MIDCEDYKGDTYRNCELETPGCKCAELDRLRDENAELREARPFAVDHGPHGAFFQPSALAAARAILAKTAKEGN